MASIPSYEDRVESVELTLFGDQRGNYPGLVKVVQGHEKELSEIRFYQRFARTFFAFVGVSSLASIISLILLIYSFLRTIGVIP